MYGISRIALLAAVLALGTSLPAPVHAAGVDDEWFVATTLNRQVISGDLTILVLADKPFLPFDVIAEAALVPIDRAEDGVITGSLFTNGDSFSLDRARGTLAVNGSAVGASRRDFVMHGGKLYVAAHLFGPMMGVEAAFDPRRSALALSSKDPLPVDVRRRQENARELRMSQLAELKAPLPLDVPYDLFSPPTADIALAGRFVRNGGAELGYDAVIGGDVAYMTSQAFVSGGTRSGLSDARWRVGRQDPDGGMLGAGFREIWIGDVRGTSLPLVGAVATGRGATASTFPLDRADAFDLTTIDGDAPPGWGVELYQNGMLVDFQVVGPDGRYLFEDVALTWGRNEFRLVLLGAQGQQREETREVNVGMGMATPGETHYRISVGQPQRGLFDEFLQRRIGRPDLGFAAEVEHGISRDLSVNAYVARHQTGLGFDPSFAITAGAGVQRHWRDVTWRGSAAFQDHGGKAVDVGAFGRLAGMTVSGQFAFYDDFWSLAASDEGRRLRARTTIRASGVVSGTPAGQIWLFGRAEHLVDVDGGSRVLLGGNVRHRIAGAAFDHGFEARLRQAGLRRDRLDLIYAPTASVPFGKLSLRGSARFALTGDDAFRSAGAGLRYAIDERSSFGSQFTYLPGGKLFAGANYSYAFDQAILSLQAGVDTKRDVSVGVGLNFSLGFDRGGRPFASRYRLAQQGAVMPFVFHDRDADGVYDASVDEPLDDVALKVDGRPRSRTRTDESGQARLVGLPPSRRVGVDVDERTLPDPFMLARNDPVSVRPRPGRVVHLDIPIVEGGEVGGTVWARSADGAAVSDVEVEAVRPDGTVAASTRTHSDGFYLIEKLPPGTYVLRLAAGQEVRGSAVATPSREVEIGPDGTILDGLDFVAGLPEEPEWDEEDDESWD